MTVFLFLAFLLVLCPKPTLINWFAGTLLKQKKKWKSKTWQLSETDRTEMNFWSMKGELAWLDFIKNRSQFCAVLTAISPATLSYVFRGVECIRLWFQSRFSVKFVLQTEISFFRVRNGFEASEGNHAESKIPGNVKNWCFWSVKNVKRMTYFEYGKFWFIQLEFFFWSKIW